MVSPVEVDRAWPSSAVLPALDQPRHNLLLPFGERFRLGVVRLAGLEAFEEAEEEGAGFYIALESHFKVAVQHRFVRRDELALPALDNRDLAPEHLANGGGEAPRSLR